MFKLAVLCLFAGVALAAYAPHKVIKVVEKPTEAPEPTPYEFSYEIVDEDGNKQGRSESGDGAGNKKGGYSIQLADGRQRWVEYVADADGFRAVIRTNEPGTEDQDPADVDLTVEGVVEEMMKAVEEPKEEEPKEEEPKEEEPKEEEPKRKYKIIKVPIHGYGYH